MVRSHSAGESQRYEYVVSSSHVYGTVLERMATLSATRPFGRSSNAGYLSLRVSGVNCTAMVWVLGVLPCIGTRVSVPCPKRRYWHTTVPTGYSQHNVTADAGLIVLANRLSLVDRHTNWIPIVAILICFS